MDITDTTADKLAMLLSTDWFDPYWALIGVQSGDGRECLRKGCREIVKRMIAGAQDYFLISFADDRVDATRNAVQELARRCNLSSDAVQRISDLCTPRVKRHEKQTTAWLFGLSSDLILSDEQLDASIRNVVKQARAQHAYDEGDLEQSCKMSPTQWDIYIRHLTPDVPGSLKDFVWALVNEWQLDSVLQCLDSEQRKTLYARYRAAALRATELTENDLNTELPDSWR